MTFVNGLGGAFIFSEDPERLARWYEDSFGLDFEQYGKTTFGITFSFPDAKDPARRRETVLSVMKAKSPIPEMPGNAEAEDMYGDQPFMLNLRVDDIEATLAYLASRGIQPLMRQDEDYGRFAWVRDPDGRRLELWEPGTPFKA